MSVLVATAEGLLRVEENGKAKRLADGPFRHVVPTDEEGEAVALDAAGTVWDVDDEGAHDFGELGGVGAVSVLVDGDTVWLGTRDARLFRTDGDELLPVEGFDRVEGRDRWHTPTGGSPAVRSLDIDDEGTLYAGVHVGGIVRSLDGGGTWEPTCDIALDVHQVYAVPGRAGTVVAACGRGGLAVSTDRGETWRVETGGLPVTYCRAVAVGGDSVVLSASQGPQGGEAGLFRRALDGDVFVPCRGGFPESVPGNIDTHCVAAWDERVVAALPTGDLYLSNDAGWAWRRVVGGLVEPHAVTIL